MNASTEHPNSKILALYESGDLPLLFRLRTGRHIRHCADCEQKVAVFRSARAELKRQAAAQVLTGFEAIADWHTLERDMLGNIAVGIDASRCIENVGRHRKLALRFAWAVGMCALFAAGWFTRIPAEDSQRIWSALRRAAGLDQQMQVGSLLRSTKDGIAVRAHGATLTILSPPSAVVSVTGPATVTARYVDEESGDVTITNVYGQ